MRQSLGLELLHEQTREGALRTMIASRPGDFAAQDVGKYIENWNGTRRLLVTPVNATQIYLALTCLQDDEARNLPLNRRSGSTPSRAGPT